MRYMVQNLDNDMVKVTAVGRNGKEAYIPLASFVTHRKNINPEDISSLTVQARYKLGRMSGTVEVKGGRENGS